MLEHDAIMSGTRQKFQSALGVATQNTTPGIPVQTDARDLSDLICSLILHWYPFTGLP